MSGTRSLDPRFPPSWLTSQEELEYWAIQIGQERGLDEAAVRQRIPAIMRWLWRFAAVWRLSFEDGYWLNRRRGEGDLLSDRPDRFGGFGALGNYIDRTTWRASLDWVRYRFEAGRIDEPYEFAHIYLGLSLQDEYELRILPPSASLEVKFNALEAALIDVLAAEQQSHPPSPQMNLHLHATMPSESDKSVKASQSSDQIADHDAIFPSGTAGRPTYRDLILLEMYRRAHRKELADELAEEARQLRQWLIGKHHPAKPPGAETIENAIRQEYWELKPKPTK